MEINLRRFINELGSRTLTNYDYIKQNCKKEGLNEVTQLINSMYCLLVVPEEIFGIKKSGEKKSDFASQEKRLKKYSSYQDLATMIQEFKDKNRLKYATLDDYTENSPVSCLLYYMRNALCHDDIGFLPITSPDDKNEITDIIFRDGKGNPRFMLVLSTDQLESFLRAVAKFYSDVENRRANANEDHYIRHYNSISNDLKKFIGKYEE